VTYQASTGATTSRFIKHVVVIRALPPNKVGVARIRRNPKQHGISNSTEERGNPGAVVEYSNFYSAIVSVDELDILFASFTACRSWRGLGWQIVADLSQ
jgi:hypothetical protein